MRHVPTMYTTLRVTTRMLSFWATSRLQDGATLAQFAWLAIYKCLSMDTRKVLGVVDGRRWVLIHTLRDHYHQDLRDFLLYPHKRARGLHNRNRLIDPEVDIVEDAVDAVGEVGEVEEGGEEAFKRLAIRRRD
jgi:hypothetical protein